MVRCAGCGSSNVDYEGYCWTCERQNQVESPPPVPSQPADPYPQSRPLGPRIGMTVAGTLAVLLGIVAGGVVLGAFRSNAGMLAAQTEAAPLAGPAAGARTEGTGTGGARAGSAGAGQGTPGGPGSCLAGGWRITAVDEDFQLDGVGPVHFGGTGGTMTFRGDGTGTWDTTGTSETATVSGRRYTVTAAGTVGFHYRVDGARVQYTDVTSAATYAVQVDGARVGTGPLTVAGTDTNRVACEGGLMTLSGSATKMTLTRIS